MQARGRFQQWRSRMSRTFPPNLARLMLLMCAALWGGSFVVAKFAMQTVPPQWLTGSRMAGACLLMWPLFRKSIMRSMHRDFIIPSLVVGITYYVAMLCQVIGLQTIDPGRSAFLGGAYCVLIPLVGWVVSKRYPGTTSIIAAVICLIGVGFVALKPESLSLELSSGDWLTLLSAFLFAVNIVYLGIYSRRFHPIAVAFVQFAISAVCFYASALFTEPRPNASWFEPQVVWSFLYLVIGATMIGQILQNVGLAHVPTTNAAILMSTESIFSVMFSVIFWGESVGWTLIIGFALIFVAVLMSVVKVKREISIPIVDSSERPASLEHDTAAATASSIPSVVHTTTPLIRPHR